MLKIILLCLGYMLVVNIPAQSTNPTLPEEIKDKIIKYSMTPREFILVDKFCYDKALKSLANEPDKFVFSFKLHADFTSYLQYEPPFLGLPSINIAFNDILWSELETLVDKNPALKRLTVQVDMTLPGNDLPKTLDVSDFAQKSSLMPDDLKQKLREANYQVDLKAQSKKMDLIPIKIFEVDWRLGKTIHGQTKSDIFPFGSKPYLKYKK
jgi:hypothetical protein